MPWSIDEFFFFFFFLLLKNENENECDMRIVIRFFGLRMNQNLF